MLNERMSDLKKKHTKKIEDTGTTQKIKEKCSP